MALKQDGAHFVLCPEQGMYFRRFCLKQGTPILVEYCPLLPLPSLSGIALQQMLRRMCALTDYLIRATKSRGDLNDLKPIVQVHRWTFVSTMMKMMWTAEIQIIFEDMIVSVFVSTVMQSIPAARSIFEPMRDNEQNSLNPCTGQDKAMLDKSLLRCSWF